MLKETFKYQLCRELRAHQWLMNWIENGRIIFVCCTQSWKLKRLPKFLIFFFNIRGSLGSLLTVIAKTIQTISTSPASNSCLSLTCLYEWKSLKAHSQISNRGRSQKCQNLIFVTSVYSSSLKNTFPQRNWAANHFRLKSEQFSHKLSCPRICLTQ